MYSSISKYSLFIIIVGILSGCVRSYDDEVTLPKVSAVVKANHKFALDMYRALMKDTGGDNIFFSPASIAIVMAMTYHGSKGETATQLHKGLNFDNLKPAEVSLAYRELLGHLYSADQRYELRVANRLYSRLGWELMQEFRDTLNSSYQADIVAADFAGDAAGVRREINGWVSDVTRDKIVDLVAEGVLSPATALVLVNAVYFQGSWARQFDPAATSLMPFTRADGSQVKVDMMRTKAHFKMGYLEHLDTQVLELPYEGREASMLILLPHEEDGLEKLEAGLTADDLASLKRRLYIDDVEVFLPKFKMEYSAELSSALSALGISDLFNPGKADLSGIDGSRNLFVSHSIHKAFLEVNEEGSEAAAATANVVNRRRMSRVFKTDRPFLVVIQEHKASSLLFMGRYGSPGQPGAREEL